jgi:hypothetical protein
MEVSGQLHDSVALPPAERDPGSHWIRCWVGSRTDLDAVAKGKNSFQPLLGIEPRLSSLYFGQYSDWAASAP